MPNEEEKKQAKALGLEPEVVFNTISDLTVLSVRDEDTQESMFEITGYGLQVKFNRDKLNSVEDVENLLDGMKDMFRKMIMNDLLRDSETEESK